LFVFSKSKKPLFLSSPSPSHFYLKVKSPLFDRPSSGPSFEIAPRAGRCKKKKKKTQRLFSSTLGALLLIFLENKSTMKQSYGRRRRPSNRSRSNDKKEEKSRD
jgi:hypothetical protein